MKNTFTPALFLLSFLISAQTNTEVYLLDMVATDGKIELDNPKNISNNEGYDNQPSFYDGNTIIFSSTRNGQTDIAQYNIKEGTISWITNTPNGSEYSPLRIPDQNDVSAIRQDVDGTQLLYRNNVVSGNSKVLMEDLVVGYHTWYNKDIVVASVLVEDRMDLVVSNLKKKTNRTVQKKVGRSLHKIPNSNLISYISKENESWEIKSLDPVSGATKKITNTIPNVDDMCWLMDGTILMAKDNGIFKFDPKGDNKWNLLKRFEEKNMQNITRLTANSTSTLLTMVSEVSPEIIVQQQLDAYNARDIDAFMATYAEDVKVYNFPNSLDYEGKEKMRKNYASFFENTLDLHCEIKNRIVIGNKVIDEEYITANGQNFSAVAIYEVENGTIAKVTFVANE